VAGLVTRYAPTERQSEVLQALLTGKNARAIGAAIGLAPTTVENHLAALRTFYGTRTTLELACLVWGRRLAEAQKELAEERLARAKAERDLAAVDRRGRVG